MKKLIQILVFLIFSFSISAQTISFKDFQNIANNNNLSEIISAINSLGFDLQNVMEEKAGEKGLRSSGKSVFWSYKCEYNKYLDSWAINSDDFWSYLRLVQIGDVNAVWDLTLNPKFCKDYIKKFEDALKANGFKSDIHLDSQSNNITTFFEKQNFRYKVSIKQTKEFYVVAFFSTETKF